MIDSVRIVDNFCGRIDEVRASALQSGFGTWKPNKGEVGSSVYEGMSFWGLHSLMLASLTSAMRTPVFPNNMFFRVTNETTEKAYVHSDRQWGAKTCVAYLSQHDGSFKSGTGFFRHRETGLLEMPTLEEMKQMGVFDKLKEQMVAGEEKDWEQTDFVRGIYNRALIFHAPLFHSRWPKNGIGDASENGRMVWVCHFHTQETLKP